MNANSRQLEAVTVSDGPVLITAGPGTGKTFTLVQRALYLIEQCGVKPENILIATFTDKAARELITRISDELLRHNITANINDMYIGTFHSICLRLLKEFPGCSRLQKNYRVIDEFDQQYTVFRNLHTFREIDGFDDFFSTEITGHWRVAGIICGYVNKLSEELITPDELIADNDANIILIGKIFQAYKNIIASDNLLDFSSIMAETYSLLTENPAVLAKIQAKISHVMADEYQDTNHIQEKIIFLIAGERENICVVGDDDQSLYRFRGATVRNILEFPGKFAPGKCRVISLSVNYRSNIGIINFCNKWMSSTSGRGFKFDWDNFRHSKTILPSDSAQSVSSPTVAKIFATCAGEWHEKITAFIRRLKNSGKISDYNQIAFLFRSVKNERTICLAKFLEANGIKVYSPRSDMFFERREIRLAIGCLMLMFPKYVQRLENGEYNSGRHTEYYAGCLKLAAGILTSPENSALRSLIVRRGKSHIELSSTTDYAYSGLLYELFGFKPFAEILDTDLTAEVADVRPSRNLAKLTQITGKFEYLHEINTLSAKYITSDTEKFFNVYLRFLYDGGITEAEGKR